MSDTVLPFGDWLGDELSRRGTSMRSFAIDIGVHPGTVARWVDGQAIPDSANCLKIADALRVDRDYVLALAGHRPEEETDLLSQVPIEVRWYFMNYRRLPLERQKLLLRQLRAYYEDLGLEDPTKGLLTEE